MNFNDKCRQAVARLEKMGAACADSGRFIAAGYTTNYDKVTQWQPKLIDSLIEKYCKPGRDYFSSEPSGINSPEDLLWSIIGHVRRGMGGEIEIHNPRMCGFISEHFKTKSALGGTCIQAAAAVAEMNVPVLLHMTDSSGEILDQIADKPITLVCGGGRCSAEQYPAEKRTPPTVHFIFQFAKGDRIHVFNHEIDAARSNRLIVTYDEINQELPISADYLRFVENNADRISSYVISGLNCIVDEAVFDRKINILRRHLKAFKAASPSSVIYFEDAYYHRFELKLKAYRQLLPFCSMLGLNEEELGEIARHFGIQVRFDDIRSVASALEFIKNRFKIRNGIVLHTKDYALFYGEHDGIDIESGLIYANLLACAKAQNGRYGSIEEIRGIAEKPGCVSGVAFAGEAKSSEFGNSLVVIPSNEIGIPKYTIGLGDTFVGGMQLCFCPENCV